MAYRMQRTPQLKKLHTYIKKNTSKFPKLLPALRALSEFVGHEDIKDAVAKMVLFFIAQCANVKPLRRSKRRRKPLLRNKRPRKRSRTFSTSDEDDEEYVPGDDMEPGEDSVAKMALIALLTHSLQAGVDSDDEDDYEQDEPAFVAKCREKLKLLQGHFLHTLLLGKPGSGKTTFASILVDVWDALGIIDKRRYVITKRSDWVGKYQGHSVAKAKKIIEGAKGGVIFIDEAYSLISSKDGDDMYGREVLTEIVEAMSNPDKQVMFILAGYENDMKQLFTHNAGLERRFGYVFRFKAPPALMLMSIFTKQLKEARWRVDKEARDQLIGFFAANADKLAHGGGSTQQLIFHTKQSAVIRQFPEECENIVTMDDVKDGFRTYIGHSQIFKKSAAPPGMYL